MWPRRCALWRAHLELPTHSEQFQAGETPLVCGGLIRLAHELHQRSRAVGHRIDICAMREQKCHVRLDAARTRNVQRRRAGLRQRVGVGSALEERLDERWLPDQVGRVQWPPRVLLAHQPRRQCEQMRCLAHG